jgi:hypothetical protein
MKVSINIIKNNFLCQNFILFKNYCIGFKKSYLKSKLIWVICSTSFNLQKPFDFSYNFFEWSNGIILSLKPWIIKQGENDF